MSVAIIVGKSSCANTDCQETFIYCDLGVKRHGEGYGLSPAELDSLETISPQQVITEKVLHLLQQIYYYYLISLTTARSNSLSQLRSLCKLHSPN